MESREKRKQYWQEQLKEFYASGASQRKFCLDSGLSYWSFNQWKRRLESEQKSSAMTEIKFKPVLQETASANRIEIHFSNIIHISFPADISPEMLICIVKSFGVIPCR